MTYHLWEIESGSYIGQYADEAAAMRVAIALVERLGDDYADSLSLGQVRDDGAVLDPLTGSHLVDRARLILEPPAFAAIHHAGQPLKTAS